MSANNGGFLPRRNMLYRVPKLAAGRPATYGRANNKRASAAMRRVILRGSFKYAQA